MADLYRPRDRRRGGRSRAVACLLVLAGLMAGCGGGEPSYEEEIASWRIEKDRFMRESPESPVVLEQRRAFPPLSYYPVSADHRVPAALTLVTTDEFIEMSTSTGERRRMRRVGRLAFTLLGEPLTLTAFVDASDNDTRRLFVPFGDVTNRTETFPGGRYLDLQRTATNIYDLDFNRAYLPFCVFNPAYDCPVPPLENRLEVAVRAGEKLAAPYGLNTDGEQ